MIKDSAHQPGIREVHQYFKAHFTSPSSLDILLEITTSNSHRLVTVMNVNTVPTYAIDHTMLNSHRVSSKLCSQPFLWMSWFGQLVGGDMFPHPR